MALAECSLCAKVILTGRVALAECSLCAKVILTGRVALAECSLCAKVILTGRVALVESALCLTLQVCLEHLPVQTCPEGSCVVDTKDRILT